MISQQVIMTSSGSKKTILYHVDHISCNIDLFFCQALCHDHSQRSKLHINPIILYKSIQM